MNIKNKKLICDSISKHDLSNQPSPPTTLWNDVNVVKPPSNGVYKVRLSSINPNSNQFFLDITCQYIDGQFLNINHPNMYVIQWSNI